MNGSAAAVSCAAVDCEPVPVPDNAYLDRHGTDWRCERGFRRTGGQCVAIALPARAHLDFSGNDWECAVGFRKEPEGCMARPPK